ncbi:Uu.00g118020.m01.CDS01 [Anthostomella pinea]|uniref:Uu.00g118020.m01.CDS01 n=1 Tax=Anthostomella pinea TaxID=933095 RepID=A0AAI8YEK2_9PEZI|nr:Uu.00g118020.m01.CDS01 [Anthostomella pinea]
MKRAAPDPPQQATMRREKRPRTNGNIKATTLERTETPRSQRRRVGLIKALRQRAIRRGEE